MISLILRPNSRLDTKKTLLYPRPAIFHAEPIITNVIHVPISILESPVQNFVLH